MSDPPTDADWERITTLAQFRKRVAAATGVIVIHDVAAAQPIGHGPGCPFVTEDFFCEKVIENTERSGRYYWAKNSAVAAAHGARCCKHPWDHAPAV